MRHLVYFAVVTVLLLTGCVPTPEISTLTKNTMPSLTSTKILLPTATKFLTETPIPPTATVLVPTVPSYTLTATLLNFASFLTAQVSWNVCEGADEPYYEKDISPDGKWLVVACDPNDPSKFNGAKVVKLDDSAIWEVSFYDSYGVFQKNELPPDGIKEGQMGVTHWTKDGNYVYLHPYFCCADAPEYLFFNYFNNALALYRLDLRTGKITPTLQPYTDNIFAGYYVSFSPTDEYLTYVASDSPRDVHVYNLQTGDVFTVTVDKQYIASGKFSWSQDGNKAIFMAVKSGWSDWETSVSNGISYFLLDLKMQSSLHLFDQQDMYRVGWTSDGNIILHNTSGKDDLLYNFQNNRFAVVTSTPSP